MRIKALALIAVVALIILGGMKLGQWIDRTRDELASARGGYAGCLYETGR